MGVELLSCWKIYVQPLMFWVAGKMFLMLTTNKLNTGTIKGGMCYI